MATSGISRLVCLLIPSFSKGKITVSKAKTFAQLQYILPQHLLSRALGQVASCEFSWVKNPLIKAFIKQYQVDMSEAARPEPQAYTSFNDFFMRQLKAGARPVDAGTHTLVSPADGVISQVGRIEDGRLLQAKGHDFSVEALLGGNPAEAQTYRAGEFATIYLSPRDYHRVHMPWGGRLQQTRYVPGRLFSVNQATTAHVPGLFARNERLVCHFDSPQGPFVMVLVGAMIVAAIETPWAGRVVPVKQSIQETRYAQQEVQIIDLPKGAEMGRFCLGSTVIMLWPAKAQVHWHAQVQAGMPVRMGQALAKLG